MYNYYTPPLELNTCLILYYLKFNVLQNMTHYGASMNVLC